MEESLKTLVAETRKEQKTVVKENPQEPKTVVKENPQEPKPTETETPKELIKVVKETPKLIKAEESKPLSKKEVDVLAVRKGFDGARKIIQETYKKYFNSVNFTPTQNEVIADLLVSIGALSEEYGTGEYYEKAFGISTTKISQKYKVKGYIPNCFKLSVWLDKNKGETITVKLLNEVISSLYELTFGEIEVVKKSLYGVIDFIESNDIKII